MSELKASEQGKQYAHNILDPLSDDEVLDQFGADTDEEMEEKESVFERSLWAEASHRFSEHASQLAFYTGYREVSTARFDKIIKDSWNDVMH